MEEHVTTECPKAEVICPFTLHGCNFKVCFWFLVVNDALNDYSRWILNAALDVHLLHVWCVRLWLVCNVWEIPRELLGVKRLYWAKRLSKPKEISAARSLQMDMILGQSIGRRLVINQILSLPSRMAAVNRFKIVNCWKNGINLHCILVAQSMATFIYSVCFTLAQIRAELSVFGH